MHKKRRACMEKLTKKGLDGTQPVSHTHLTRSFAAQCTTAGRFFAPSKQSLRHSTQSARDVENSAAFSRTAVSVGSTIGIITLGRPSPMQQPRMLTQDVYKRQPGRNLPKICAQAEEKVKCVHFCHICMFNCTKILHKKLAI